MLDCAEPEKIVSKRKLYLHLGSPKTGTTSFQRFLNDNFHDVLNGLGLYYPFCERDGLLPKFRLTSACESLFSIEEVRHNNGQRIRACDLPFEIVAEIARVASEVQCDVVVSDESLSSSSHPDTPFVAELKRWFDVVPVVVIRDPQEYVFSSYLETLKGFSYHAGYDEFLSSQPGGAIQFRFFREWCAAFDVVKVLSFRGARFDLIRSLLKACERCDADLARLGCDYSVRSNVSLSAEAYEILRRLNREGLHPLARRFAIRCEESASPPGGAPKPDPAHAGAARALHGGLFDYLSERFELRPDVFMASASCAHAEPQGTAVLQGISARSLDALLVAVRDLVASVPTGGRGLSGRAEQSGPKSVLDRIANMKRGDSPWGKFCPPEFSAADYVAMGGILDAWPLEDLDGFDPFRHYVMYGRYAGCGIRRGISIREQVDLFACSPFVGYVPHGFDAERYLRANTDVQSAGVDPYYHWWAYGEKECRRLF